MPLFSFRAVNNEGEKISEERNAPDRFTLYRQLKNEGWTVLSTEEKKKKRKALSFSFISRLFGRVKMREKIIFARNLASMLDAGLPLSRALSIMERQTRNGALQRVLHSLQEDISAGNTLSDAMKKFPKVFSSLFVSMVHAGEESGKLAEALRHVNDQMERSYTLARKVRGAMIYPSIIVVVMFIIGILALFFIVPTLTATFEGFDIELPLSTRIVIATSGFLRDYPLIIFGLLLTAVISLVAFLRTKGGKRMFEYALLHTPILGKIAKEINSARTTRTLSSLLSSGVDMVVAVNITADVIQNSFYKDVLARTEKSIKKGTPISEIFRDYEHLYPVFVTEMISVGEETGKLSQTLHDVATFYEEEVEQKTKDMSTIIEPFLMVIIGVGVGFFAISMLAPTYSLVDVI